MPQTVRIGTRASTLALTQTGHVADALASFGDLSVETVRVRTDGDRLTGSLSTLGGTGVFVTALRDALLDGRCDVAVHSLKDLPTADPDGLALAAVPKREDPRDVLCARDGLTLASLPPGAKVGTGSPRRAAQLRAARPDLDIVDIRGNVDTRLGRVAGATSPADGTRTATTSTTAGGAPDTARTGPRGDLDAVVLARAGLARLGRLDAVTEVLDLDVMLPAPGQGALAVETRTAGPDVDPDGPLATALRALEHRPTRLAVLAERALLARLEAGCAAPVGAYAEVDEITGRIALQAVVARTDGSAVLRRSVWAQPVVVRMHDDGPATAPDEHQDEDGREYRDAAEHTARSLGTNLAELLLEDGAADLADLRVGR